MDSIRSFAEKCDVSQTIVKRWIAQGRIIAQKNGYAWVILGHQKKPADMNRGRPKGSKNKKSLDD